MNRDEKYVLHKGLSLFNGYFTDITWTTPIKYPMEVDLGNEIDDEWLFDSYQSAETFRNSDKNLSNYEPIKYADIPLKSKSLYTYNPFNYFIKSSNGTEVCVECGINLIAEEKYLANIRGVIICLHCALNSLASIDSAYDKVDEQYKKFWNDNVKNEVTRKCSGLI